MKTLTVANINRLLVYGILATLPFERIPSFSFGASQTTVRVSQLLALFLILLSLPAIWRRRGDLFRTPWRYLVAFNIINFLASFTALDSSIGLRVAIFTTFVSVVAWVISLNVDLRKLATYDKIIFGVTGLMGLFALYQFFGDLVGLPTSVTGLRDTYTKLVFGFPRIQAASLEPLYFANFLLIPLGLSLAWITHRVSKWRPAAMIGILTLLWLTLSRGAIVAAGAMIILAILAQVLVQRWRAVIVVLASVVGSGLLALAMINVASRIDVAKKTQHTNTVSKFTHQTTNFSQGESAEGRTVTRELAIKAFTERPVTGIGPGNFGIYANQQRPEKFKDTNTIANNEPLKVLAETGVLGFISLLLFALSTSWIALKKIALGSGAPRYWTFGLLLALIGITLQYQTFSTLYIMHIWVTVGLLLGISHATSQKTR